MRNKLLAILFTTMSFFSYTVNASSDSTAPPPINITPADNFQGSSGWVLVQDTATTSRVNLPTGSSFVSIEGQLYATNKSYSFTQNGSAGACTWSITPKYVSGCSRSKNVPAYCESVQTGPPQQCGANTSEMCTPETTTCYPARTYHTRKYISQVYISR